MNQVFRRIGNLALGICIAVFLWSTAAEANVITQEWYTIFGDYVDTTENVVWIKQGNAAIIKPPNEYQITLEPEGTFSTELEIRNGMSDFSVYLGNGEEERQVLISERICVDAVAPKGRLLWGGSTSPYISLHPQVSFSSFYQDAVEVSIRAEDSESGIQTIEYYVSERDLLPNAEDGAAQLESVVGNNWRLYEGTLFLTPGKYVVYAKITDRVGHVTYQNTDGIVVYQAPQITLSEIVYCKGDAGLSEVTTEIEMKGNTIKEIVLLNASNTSQALTQGRDYTVNVDETNVELVWAESLLENLVPGEYTLKIFYNPQGETFVSSADSEEPAAGLVSLKIKNWGQPGVFRDVINYVQTDGKTSAKITENDLIWIQENANGQSMWFALDNRAGVFDNGARFWVQWLSKEADTDAWTRYYNQLDESRRKDVENGNLALFLTGVEDTDGCNYTELPVNVDMYVQLPDSWDTADTKAVFVSGGTDEALSVTVQEQDMPGGKDTFAKLTLSHFSPYAVYDILSAAEKSAQQHTGSSQTGNSQSGSSQGSTVQTVENTPDTGDAMQPLLWLVVVAGSGMTAIGAYRKRKQEK